MKKTVALLLALCACFSFVACEDDPAPAHEHAYATEWSKDGENHWHACTGADCTEVSDKAGHSWNDGEITTQPSASADGVKTYTCTVCSQTKTEAVAYVADHEVTAEEWLAALSFTGADNYELTAASGSIEQVIRFDGTTAYTTGVDMSGNTITYYYTKEGTAYYVYEVSGGVIEKDESTERSYLNAKSAGLGDTFLAGAFTYDAQSKTYKADEISMYDGMVKYTEVSIAFADNKLVSIAYTYAFNNGTPTAGTVEVTYDTVQTIVIPTNTVDEAQMLVAIENAKNDQVSKSVTFSYADEFVMIYTINEDKYSYFSPNLEEYVFVTDGFKIYNRIYDEDTGAWGAWTVKTAQSEASFLQSYEYMNKPNLYLKYYAPTSFADMHQAEDGGYEYTIDDDSYKVYFVGGKLTKFIAYDGSDAITLDYKYGDYTVEIPQV